MASFIYNSCLRDTFRGRIDFENDAFRVILLSGGYQPDKEVHVRRSDLTDEVVGAGYEAGGKTVDVRISMKDDALTLSLGGVEFKGSISARYAAYVTDRGDPESDELIALVDFGGDVTSTNAPWSLSASSLRITHGSSDNR